MADKWILIVDDEENLLSILKNSLIKLGRNYRIVTASNGSLALEQLKQFHFDLIVTDYKMGGMNGLELLENIRMMQPKARVILMTAYGNSAVEAEASRLNAYRYLKKPLEIEAFREIVREATADAAAPGSGVMVLSEQDYREIDRMLSDLHAVVKARYTVITDIEGRYITCRGVYENLPLTTIASLLGGSLATLTEAGRMIDNRKDATHLAFREGVCDDLYVVNAGRMFLLTLLVAHDPAGGRLCTVWSSIQKTVASLQERFTRTDRAGTGNVITKDFEQAFSGQLQNLMDGRKPETDARPAPPAAPPSAPPAGASSEPLFKPGLRDSAWADKKDEKENDRPGLH